MNKLEKVSEETKKKILQSLIEPSYFNDVNDMINGRRCWRITGQTFETASKVLVAIGGILSFSSGFYNDTTLSFLAGSVSTISLACLQFASFSYAETTRQTKKLNQLLEKLNIDTVPTFSHALDEKSSSEEPVFKKSNGNSQTTYSNTQHIHATLPNDIIINTDEDASSNQSNDNNHADV